MRKNLPVQFLRERLKGNCRVIRDPALQDRYPIRPAFVAALQTRDFCCISQIRRILYRR